VRRELQQQIDRLDRFPIFLESLAVCFCAAVLKCLEETTPGTHLPQEWTMEIQKTTEGVHANIWNLRVEQHPEFEQILFYLDLGTSAHWIFPVNAQALSWVEDGIRYFSKGHQVSGIKASHFHSQTLRVIEQFEKTIPWWWDQYIRIGALPK
jgi:hypothetical protein